MLTGATIFVIGSAVLSPATAVSYDCPSKSTAVVLNDHDIAIAKREASIAEMRAEIVDAGGSTDDQRKLLESLQGKLATMKDARAKLIDECAGKAAR